MRYFQSIFKQNVLEKYLHRNYIQWVRLGCLFFDLITVKVTVLLNSKFQSLKLKKLVFSSPTCQANKYVQTLIDTKCIFFRLHLISSCCPRSNTVLAPDLSHHRQCYMLIDSHDNIATFVCGQVLLIQKNKEAPLETVAIKSSEVLFISLFSIFYFIFMWSLRIICLNHMNCLRFPKRKKHINVGDIRLRYFSYWISNLRPNRVSRFI